MKYKVKLTGKARRDLKSLDNSIALFISQNLKKLEDSFDELVQHKKLKNWSVKMIFTG